MYRCTVVMPHLMKSNTGLGRLCWGTPASRVLRMAQQLFRVECTVGRFFVLEICKDIAVVGQVLLEFRCVLLAFFLGIFAFAQAVVAEDCGYNIRALELFAFGVA